MTFFDIEDIYFQVWFFKALISLSATENFSLLCVEHISIFLSYNDELKIDYIFLAIFCLVYN